MKTALADKSSTEKIRERFDKDVERFSNLETGQKAVIDAPLMLDLISKLSVKIVPHAVDILDIGCGAGNNTIRIVREKKGLNCDLVDLSMPMLEKAKKRLEKERHIGEIKLFHGDIRTLDLPSSHYDLIVAAAVFHHLRDEQDWESTFKKVFDLLRSEGALFVSDMVTHEDPIVHDIMWNRYGTYLENLGGPEYRKTVFDYIDDEDSPRDLNFQIALLREVGFRNVEVLHKNSCFATFMGIKK